MKCCVRNCDNETRKKTGSQGTSFHLFPREPTIRKAWMEALGLTESEFKEKSTVCSEHFYSQDFYETRCGLRKVKDGAIPLIVQDEEEQLETPANFTVCRVCLTTEGKMHNIRDNKLDTVYQQISGTVISSDDKLPQKLCWECVHRLLTHVKFKDKVARSQNLMLDLLSTRHFLTVKDIKTIDRTAFLLKSTLINKLYDASDYDYILKHSELYVKTESIVDEDDLVKTESIHVDSLPIIEVEIKNENSNDFFDETPNVYDSEDDVKLSEVVKPKKKKKVRVRVKKKERIRVEKEEVADEPADTVHAFMKSYVKRRKTNDGLDESLFTVSAPSYDEQIAEVERRQESSTFKNSAYKCTICYRGFHIKDRYDAHIVRHSEQSGAFECFICKTRLKSARALRKHITAQHTEMFSCKGCPFTTKNRGVAREHAKWHAGTKYQCPNCPSEFDKLTTYLGHIRIKHVSDFVCELCGFTFVSKKGIEVHKKKKHRLAEKSTEIEGPYCEVCDVRFVSEEAHSRHLKLSSKHSSDNDPNRIRNDSQSVNAHRGGRVMRRVERRPLVHARDPAGDHGAHAGPITCEQCGIQLRDLRLYAQHFRRAHPDKNRTKYPAMKTPAMCEQCGRIFQSMALLKDHMWVHTGEKRFKCDRCDKSFTQKSNLVFHLRSHSATRPSYECPLCGKHFAFFNNRRRHMFIHTGLKPFKCDTCGKCFTTSGEQRAHVEHVHMKKPWPKRAKGRHDVWQKGDPCED